MRIDNGELAGIIVSGADKLNISLPPGALDSFGMYYRFLEERGQNINLTAIEGLKDVAALHFLDSLALLNTARFKDARVIDVGSGAGFPGVPLKIAEPSIKLTLLDSAGKRIMFLRELCELLEIEAVCVHARAEESANETCMRESYDIAVSRAVAELNILCELCLPYVRIGGFFIAMKSTGSGDETGNSCAAMNMLGAELQSCIDYAIPGTDISHRAVVIHKIAYTPVKYPRRYARIKKTPL